MYFYLITFLICVGTTLLSWTSLATTKVGIANIIPCIYETAKVKLVSQGLSIFCFAFFLYALLQSKAIQSLFASQRKWLQKRKYFTIGLITIASALLATSLSWFDEFVHFYPLVVPLLLAMGFDIFSSILCLYGGAIAGLIAIVSPERMGDYFGQAFSSVGEKTNFTGKSGVIFRIINFFIFTTIVVLFNLWYSSRNQQRSQKKAKVLNVETPPVFTRTRKIILGVAGFFLLTTILSQLVAPRFIDKLEKNTPKQISNSFEETEYEKVGEIEKMPIAKVEEEQKSQWGKFGSWEAMALDCWLVMGGIIICLIGKQSVMGTFVESMQNSIPLVLIYIFAAAPITIMKKAGLDKGLTKVLLSDKVIANAKYYALIPVFGLSLLSAFIISSSAIVLFLISSLAPALLAISKSTLLYAAIFAWMGAIIGMAYSPNNGILAATLEKNKVTYKQFLKKTWMLGLIILVVAFSWIFIWTKFGVK